jgi:hypothetical protein
MLLGENWNCSKRLCRLVFVVADVRVKSPVSQRFRAIGGCGVVTLELGFKGGSPTDRLRAAMVGGFDIGTGGGVTACCIVLGSSAVEIEE